jgi:hypothetical protein
MTTEILTKSDLAERWKTSQKTVDRMRERGVLPWVDLNQGKLGKPTVRFRLSDIVAFESAGRVGGFNIPAPQQS